MKSAAAGWSLLRSQDLILACALLEQHPLSQSGCFTVSLGNQQSAIISRDSPGEADLRAANGLQWRGTKVVVVVVGSGQRRNTPHLGPSVVISNSVLVKRMVDHYLKPSDLQSPGWAWHLNAVGVSWPSVAPVKSFGSADPFLPNLSLSLSGEGLIWFPDQFD